MIYFILAMWILNCNGIWISTWQWLAVWVLLILRVIGNIAKNADK